MQNQLNSYFGLRKNAQVVIESNAILYIIRKNSAISEQAFMFDLINTVINIYIHSYFDMF